MLFFDFVIDFGVVSLEELPIILNKLYIWLFDQQPKEFKFHASLRSNVMQKNVRWVISSAQMIFNGEEKISYVFKLRKLSRGNADFFSC